MTRENTIDNEREIKRDRDRALQHVRSRSLYLFLSKKKVDRYERERELYNMFAPSLSFEETRDIVYREIEGYGERERHDG